MTDDYETLLRKKAEIEASIAEILKSEKNKSIASARNLIELFQLKPADVFASNARNSQDAGHGAKSRDPTPGSTRPGRGKPPDLIKNC